MQHTLLLGGVNLRVLDIGCGNGVLGLWAAKKLRARVVGIDISNAAIGNSRKNARNLCLVATYACADAEDWLKKDRRKYDLIIANTPSFPDSSYRSERGNRFLAKGNGTGNRLLMTIAENVHRVLDAGGYLLTMAHSEQNIPLVVRCMRRQFSEVRVFEQEPKIPNVGIFRSMRIRHVAHGYWTKDINGRFRGRSIVILARR